MSRYVCVLSVIPIRKEPDDTAEIISQLLFGEYLEVLEENNQWRKIKCMHDGYEGWIDEKQIQPISESAWERIKSLPSQRLLLSTLPIVTPDGSVMEILKGSELNGLLNREASWSNQYKLFYEKESLPPISEIAYSYLNSPYLWGGRNPFGIDCSGFTQLVAAFHGIQIPRDAKDQVHHGTKVHFDQIQPGDFVYFINDQDKIHHVGIAMEKDKIIHASGHVRIDTLTEEGIIHKESKKLTHKYFAAKRL